MIRDSPFEEVIRLARTFCDWTLVDEKEILLHATPEEIASFSGMALPLGGEKAAQPSTHVVVRYEFRTDPDIEPPDQLFVVDCGGEN